MPSVSTMPLSRGVTSTSPKRTLTARRIASALHATVSSQPARGQLLRNIVTAREVAAASAFYEPTDFHSAASPIL